MKIRSQLTTPQVAVDRNVDNTVIDKISTVNSNIDVITALGATDVIDDMSVLADVDFTAISNKVATLDGLTVSVVETLPAGSQATAELNGSVIELRIPKGLDGTNGTNGVDGVTPVKGVDYVDGYTPVKGVDYTDGVDGYTPIKGIDYYNGKPGIDGHNGGTPIVEFTYNNATGDIDYEVVGYDDMYAAPVPLDELTKEW